MTTADFPIGPREFPLVAAACRATGHPLLIEGPPGSGKSSSIESYAEASGAHIEVVLASIREPSDFAGLPVIDRTASAQPQVYLAPPDWAVRLCEQASNAILFLDEVNLATYGTQGALLRVVQEGVVGSIELPRCVWVVAAANEVRHSAGGFELAPAFADRFIRVDFRLSVDEFVSGTLGEWGHLEQPTIPDNWRSKLPAARALVCGFLSARPALLTQVPDDSAGSAFPTPRSWSTVIDLLAVVDSAALDEETFLVLVAGAVGQGPAFELLAFRSMANLVDPEAALRSPGTVTLPTQDDELMATFGAIVAAVLEDSTVERWRAAWLVLDRGAGDRPDVAASAAIGLARNPPPGASMPRLHNLDKALRRAGLVTS